MTNDDVIYAVLDDTEGLQDVVDQVRRLHEQVLRGARTVVVDVSQVRALSSTTIAGLLAVQRACRVRGGSVVLRSPGRRLSDRLARTGMQDVFHLEDPVTPVHGGFDER
ncbi:MAG: STAS domain-containing protein [Actinomycetes bacterium]